MNTLHQLLSKIGDGTTVFGMEIHYPTFGSFWTSGSNHFPKLAFILHEQRVLIYEYYPYTSGAHVTTDFGWKRFIWYHNFIMSSFRSRVVAEDRIADKRRITVLTWCRPAMRTVETRDAEFCIESRRMAEENRRWQENHSWWKKVA